MSKVMPYFQLEVLGLPKMAKPQSQRKLELKRKCEGMYEPTLGTADSSWLCISFPSCQNHGFQTRTVY